MLKRADRYFHVATHESKFSATRISWIRMTGAILNKYNVWNNTNKYDKRINAKNWYFKAVHVVMHKIFSFSRPKSFRLVTYNSIMYFRHFDSYQITVDNPKGQTGLIQPKKKQRSSSWARRNHVRAWERVVKKTRGDNVKTTRFVFRLDKWMSRIPRGCTSTHNTTLFVSPDSSGGLTVPYPEME